MPACDNPLTSTFTSTGAMHYARSGHTATVLPDGRVLMVGGSTPGGLPLIASTPTAEVWAPWTGTFTMVNPMATPRSGHTSTLLPSGLVLVAGGYDGNVYQPRAELFESDWHECVHGHRCDVQRSHRSPGEY